MSVATVFKLLLVAALAAGAWHYGGRGSFGSGGAPASLEADRAALARKIQQEVQGLGGRVAPAVASGGTVAPAAPTAVRKCLLRGKVLYTDDRCPPGADEDKLRHGTVTVVAPPAGPPSPGSSLAGPGGLLPRDALPE